MKFKYSIITPVKNEEMYFPKTIKSVLDQNIRPEKWIIINDRSTDKTGEIIKDLSAEHKWVIGIDNTEPENNKGRRMGGQAVIHLGFEQLQTDKTDFIIRMDADVEFMPTFFSNIFKEFEKNPRLGIASGVCYVFEKNKQIEEKHPRFHTRGPLKVYRSKCLLDIGGLDQEEGWDTIDEVKANMKGWETQSFPEFKVTHLRKTQTASGAIKGFKNIGSVSFYTGYQPFFMLLRVIRNMLEKPYILGGLVMLWGYLEGYLKNLPRINDSEFIRYLRKQQINKMLGKSTIWK